MNRVALIGLSCLMAGCVALDEGAEPRNADLVADAEIVADLYAGTSAAVVEPGSLRAQARFAASCQDPRQSLRTALMLGNTARVPEDGELARQLLQACLGRARSSLLRGYVQNQLALLEREQQHQADARDLLREIAEKRSRVNELQVQLGELQAQLGELERGRVRSMQARIQHLEVEIASLQDKIRQLTSIEQRLNKEVQTP